MLTFNGFRAADQATRRAWGPQVQVVRKPSDGGAVITLELDSELDLPWPAPCVQSKGPPVNA
jgi:hypothetical protein